MSQDKKNYTVYLFTDLVKKAKQKSKLEYRSSFSGLINYLLKHYISGQMNEGQK